MGYSQRDTSLKKLDPQSGLDTLLFCSLHFVANMMLNIRALNYQSLPTGIHTAVDPMIPALVLAVLALIMPIHRLGTCSI